MRATWILGLLLLLAGLPIAGCSTPPTVADEDRTPLLDPSKASGEDWSTATEIRRKGHRVSKEIDPISRLIESPESLAIQNNLGIE